MLTSDTTNRDEVHAVNLPTSSGPIRADSTRLLRSGRFHTLAAGSIIILVTLVMFWDNVTGASSPQWDFYSHYTSESWAWWRDGSLLQQPQWMPYAWGGYPALLNVQNGSWYLPTGLAIGLFGPLTIKLAAVLAAAHVAFGSFGAFLLFRSWRIAFVPALFGSVAWVFAAGFYSNASHLDISRAYAWLPWVFLVIGATWRWDRWWNWPISGVIIWQSLLGIYPGILVALVYVGGAYIVTTQLVLRPKVRSYLLPLLISGGAAALMALLRYLPFYLVRGSTSPSGSDASTFVPEMFGTFLFPYGSSELPNDISMRSFFLPAAIFVLLPFAAWTSRRLRPAIVATAVAVVLCFPFWPWHEAARALPGMALSRFTMSDFKPFLLLGLVAIAVVGLSRLERRIRARPIPLDSHKLSDHVIRLVAMLLIVGAFVFVAWHTIFPQAVAPPEPDFFARDAVFTQLGFLAGSAGIVALLSLPDGQRFGAPVMSQTVRVGLSTVLILLAASSGAASQWSTPSTWQSDRPTIESTHFGTSVDNLISQGQQNAAGPIPTQRPERVAPDGPVSVRSEALATKWSASFYTGETALLGYVNLKGTATFETIQSDLFTGTDHRRADALAFWSAGGLLLDATRFESDGYPSTTTTAACATAGACGAAKTSPLAYASGDLRYEVQTERETTVIANEAWYEGWHVEICEIDGTDCQEASNVPSPQGGIQFSVPPGTWTVALQYHLPGEKASYLAFAIGAGLLSVGSIVVLIHAVRRRRNGLPEASDLRRVTATNSPRSSRSRLSSSRLFRFGLTGAFNSAVHAGIVFSFGLLTGSSHGTLLVFLAWLICIPIGYWTQAKWVWKARLSWTGLGKIAISQIPSILFSTGVAAITGAIGWPLAAQEVAALVIGAGVSYVLQRFWVFRGVHSVEPTSSNRIIGLGSSSGGTTGDGAAHPGNGRTETRSERALRQSGADGTGQWTDSE